MREKTLSDILGDFLPAEDGKKESVKSGGPVTIWLPASAKVRYDRLQESSGRRFGKKAREALIALIDIAETRTA